MIAPCCGVTVASASDAVPVVLFCLFAKFQTPFPCTVCFHIGVRLSLTIRGPSDAISMLVPHTNTHTHTGGQPHAVCVNSLPRRRYRLRLHSWLRRSAAADVSAVLRPLCGICRHPHRDDEIPRSRVQQRVRTAEETYRKKAG